MLESIPKLQTIIEKKKYHILPYTRNMSVSIKTTSTNHTKNLSNKKLNQIVK